MVKKYNLPPENQMEAGCATAYCPSPDAQAMPYKSLTYIEHIQI
jgi:hypothetical protein